MIRNHDRDMGRDADLPEGFAIATLLVLAIVIGAPLAAWVIAVACKGTAC